MSQPKMKLLIRWLLAFASSEDFDSVRPEFFPRPRRLEARLFKCYTPLIGHVIPDVDVGAKRLLTIGYYYGNIIFIQKFRDRRSNYLKVAITIKLYWTINFSLSIGNAEN